MPRMAIFSRCWDVKRSGNHLSAPGRRYNTINLRLIHQNTMLRSTNSQKWPKKRDGSKSEGNWFTLLEVSKISWLVKPQDLASNNANLPHFEDVQRFESSAGQKSVTQFLNHPTGGMVHFPTAIGLHSWRPRKILNAASRPPRHGF